MGNDENGYLVIADQRPVGTAGDLGEHSNPLLKVGTKEGAGRQ
jgi:hypothetical protein